MSDERQYELVQEIIKSTGINIVTCGMCGETLLHKLSDEEVECPYCEFKSEQSDFPDLFY